MNLFRRCTQEISSVQFTLQMTQNQRQQESVVAVATQLRFFDWMRAGWNLLERADEMKWVPQAPLRASLDNGKIITKKTIDNLNWQWFFFLYKYYWAFFSVEAERNAKTLNNFAGSVCNYNWFVNSSLIYRDKFTMNLLFFLTDFLIASK